MWVSEPTHLIQVAKFMVHHNKMSRVEFTHF